MDDFLKIGAPFKTYYNTLYNKILKYNSSYVTPQHKISERLNNSNPQNMKTDE